MDKTGTEDRVSTMPLNMSLLYGEMAGSWLIHLGIPVIASVVVTAIPGLSRALLPFLLIVTLLSFILQFVLLLPLQSTSCKGVHNLKSIAMGAAGSAVLTGVMTAIPLYYEPARLLVSQLVVSHRFVATPETERENEAIAAATAVLRGVQGTRTGSESKTEGGISLEEYATQTWTEQIIGASYWAAFAGAYGIGLSSLFVAKC